jgi:hypothetical protein
MRDGSMLGFLAIQIMRCSSLSLVSVAGASLGATIGSIVAPGPGSVVGAYLGSQIMTLIARTVIYELTAELPMKQNIKRMVLSYRILQKNPADEKARLKYTESSDKISRKVMKEFKSEKFRLFEAALKEIDELQSEDRIAMVPLLKELQNFSLSR